ncbi:MAG: hypothetical protein JWM27_963 [Gemmatimonadetes bacterium]|nr:hypothetical protein [Gemmatimonadota bacterium]
MRNNEAAKQGGGSMGEAEGSRRTWVAIIIAITVASLAFRLLEIGGLQHTSAVFVGIPAILAIALVLSPKPGTPQGVAGRAVALGLLVAGIVFGEGFVCLLMASPLFFGVAALVTAIVNRSRKRSGGSGGKTYALMLVLLTPAALEGVIPGFEVGREEAVTVERTVAGTPEQVAAALARTARFDRTLPAFFQLGFPMPMHPSGSGLAVGSVRTVGFDHGHHGSGTLALRVVESAPGRVSFAAERDDSYLLHWLTWRGAEVRWAADGAGRTRVRWTLRYRRRLDPAWYFGPLERYGTRQAAGYLIDSLARPRAGE